MSTHPSDPVETPAPVPVQRHARQVSGISGADRGLLGDEPSRSAPPDLHECLHLELIDDVRQARKRRVPLTIVLISVAASAILTVAAVLYGQGQAAGSVGVRVEALEQRASEDRNEGIRDREQQRQDATDAAVRDTQILQTLHVLDSRLGRIEERLAPQR